MPRKSPNVTYIVVWMVIKSETASKKRAASGPRVCQKTRKTKKQKVLNGFVKSETRKTKKKQRF